MSRRNVMLLMLISVVLSGGTGLIVGEWVEELRLKPLIHSATLAIRECTVILRESEE